MSLVPSFKYPVPKLDHDKVTFYDEYPVVWNEAATNRAFYVTYPFTFVTSDATVTTLYKWNGNGWTEVAGISNPEYIFGRGYYSVTTSSAAYVTVTEHTTGAQYEA